MRGKNIKWLSLVALLLVNIFVSIAASPLATKMCIDPSKIWSPTTLPESPIILRPNADATLRQWISVPPGPPPEMYFDQNSNNQWDQVAPSPYKECAIRDNDDSGTYTTGDVLLAGSPAPTIGRTLKVPGTLDKFADNDGDGTWDVGEPAYRDSGSTPNKVDATDVLLAGTATSIGKTLLPPTPQTHYTNVDETSQNSDTDYVFTTLSGRTESSQLENVASPPSWQPANVRVVVYARANTTTGAYLYLTIYAAGKRDYSVDFINLTTSYEMYHWDWGKNPGTDAPWTWSDINALEAGERSYIQSGSPKCEIRVTQLYVEVSGPRVEFNVDVQNVADLYGWQFALIFNPRIVEVTAVIEGPFLKPSTTEWLVKINNTAGYALVSDMLWPLPPQGVNGSGTLAKVILKVVGKGATLLDLTETKLNTVIADNPVPIEHTTEDGVFDNRIENENVPPIASFIVEPSVANVNDTINFDASTSYDPDAWLVSYHWDFGDGTTKLFMREELQDINLTAKATHSYIHGGLYTVTLTVTDNDGATAAAKTSVTIQGHDVAVTNVKSIYIAAMQGVQVPVNVTVANNGDFIETFNVTAYYNETAIETQKVIDMPPHTEKPLTFTLNTTNLDFDKYVLKANATIVEDDYDPSNNKYIDGTVAVALTNIVDYLVVVGGFTFHVIVESNSTPSNYLQFNPAEKKIGFNVEGKTDTPAFCNVTIPVDLLGGPYTVLLNDTLISPKPKETTNGTHTSLYFTYTHSLHNILQIRGKTVAMPPIAIFTMSTTRAIARTLVTFNATDSYARVPYGTIANYTWNFDDGNTTWLTDPVIKHAYTTAGSYTVTLTVKDNKQLTNSTQAQITVIDYPTADFSHLPTTPLVNETVTFNASASKPNGGSIISYQWDFGDGLTGHDKTVTHKYSNVGNYVVVLNVTDDEGLWDTENETLTVSIHNIAITDLTATPNTVKIGEQISISITVANKGNFNETFDVTAYYEDTPIDTKPVTKLASGAFWTISIAWNTTGVNAGTHTLKATATPVLGETQKDDNTFPGGTVTINRMDSQLTISASLTTLTLGETTTISGAISPVRPNVNITIQYRLLDGTWNNLPNVTTDADGNYTCNWKPEKAGTYEVKASWQGDANTQPSESDKKQITVNEPPTPINFLYVVVVAVFILSAALAVYFLKIKKPRVK